MTENNDKQRFIDRVLLTDKQLDQIYQVYKELWTPPVWYPENKSFGSLAEFSIRYRCTANGIDKRLDIIDKQRSTELSVELPEDAGPRRRLLESIEPERVAGDDTNVVIRVADPNDPRDIKAIKGLSSQMFDEAKRPIAKEQLLRYLLLTEEQLSRVYALCEEHEINFDGDCSGSDRPHEFAIRYYLDMGWGGISIVLDIANESFLVNEWTEAELGE